MFTYAYVPQKTKGRGKKKEDAESDEHGEESAGEADHENNPKVGWCVRKYSITPSCVCVL